MKNSLNVSLKKHIYKLSLSGVITAISVVLVLPSFKIFQAAPFLEYNPSDIPVVLASMILGPFYGAVIAFAVSAIQALTISAQSGMYGFLMHFSATLVFAVVTGAVFCPTEKMRSKVLSRGSKIILRVWISLILGGIASVLIMIPMNLIFVPIFMGSSFDDVVPMLTSAILPFNLLKMLLNCPAVGILFAATKTYLSSTYYKDKISAPEIEK